MPRPKTSETNIERIIRMEEEAEGERNAVDRLAETVGRFAGTLWFVGVATVFCAGWIVLNRGEDALDPFPFHLLAGIIAFVALVLTSFVLIRQNRMSVRGDLRNHLALQVNLLAEQEGTKIIQMLESMSRQLGIEHGVVDNETKELGDETSIEAIAGQLRETIDKDTGTAKHDG
jgi:uncharacterized membrane protein